MLKSFTIEEIKEIAESNDADAVAFISDVYLSEQELYAPEDRDIIFKTLKSKCKELLIEIRLQKKCN